MADTENALRIAATELTDPAEGDVLRPYQDPRGIWTIGVGSTRDLLGRPVTAETAPITHAQAIQLCERDLRSALQTVEHDVHVPLSDDEDAALDDFIYNIGSGNFAGSTLLRDLNAGDYAAAADQFLRWNEAGGVVLAGLCRRRAAERAMFLKPDTSTLEPAPKDIPGS